MHLLTAIIVAALVVQSIGGPVPKADPKKYNKPLKDSKITEEEKKFIKDVETRFNIKMNDDDMIKLKEMTKIDKESAQSFGNLPAVIAIEIVNDTEANAKGKRTIDANLGYGYNTNNGFRYSYFGKPREEKGRFMIYPYSQHDIPPFTAKSTNGHFSNQHLEPPKTYLGPVVARPPAHISLAHGNRFHYNIKPVTEVEIQPSKAYQLVPVNQQRYNGHGQEYSGHQDTPISHQNFVPSQQYNPPHRTLFTTYHGGQLSGLSGHFPSVSNYLVDREQLFNHPQIQHLGVPQEGHGNEEAPSRKIVPIYVFRIPSSHIQNPSGSLYPNLPQDYPNAQNLNNIDFRSLVSDYISKQQQVTPTYGTPLGQPLSNYENEEQTGQEHKEQQYDHSQENSDEQNGNYESEQHGDVGQQYGAPEQEEAVQQHIDVDTQQQYNSENSQEADQQQYEPHQQYNAENSQEGEQQQYDPHQQYDYSQQQQIDGDQQQYEQPNQQTTFDPHQAYHQIKLQQIGIHGPQLFISQQPEPVYEQPAPEGYSTPQPTTSHEPQSHPDLPISENYPSNTHTRVILNPRGNFHTQTLQSMGYVTPAPEIARKLPYLVMAPSRQFFGAGTQQLYSAPAPQQGYSHLANDDSNLRYLPQTSHGFRGYRQVVDKATKVKPKTEKIS